MRNEKHLLTGHIWARAAIGVAPGACRCGAKSPQCEPRAECSAISYLTCQDSIGYLGGLAQTNEDFRPIVQLRPQLRKLLLHVGCIAVVGVDLQHLFQVLTGERGLVGLLVGQPQMVVDAGVFRSLLFSAQL